MHCHTEIEAEYQTCCHGPSHSILTPCHASGKSLAWVSKDFYLGPPKHKADALPHWTIKAVYTRWLNREPEEANNWKTWRTKGRTAKNRKGTITIKAANLSYFTFKRLSEKKIFFFKKWKQFESPPCVMSYIFSSLNCFEKNTSDRIKSKGEISRNLFLSYCVELYINYFKGSLAC